MREILAASGGGYSSKRGIKLFVHSVSLPLFSLLFAGLFPPSPPRQLWQVLTFGLFHDVSWVFFGGLMAPRLLAQGAPHD